MSVPRVTHHSLFSTILLFLSFHFNVDYFEILFYNSYFACVLTPCVFLPSFPLWERGQKLKLMVLARRIWFYLVLLSLASFIACLFLYFFFSSCEHAFLFLTLNIPQKGLFEFLILWVNILAFTISLLEKITSTFLPLVHSFSDLLVLQHLPHGSI